MNESKWKKRTKDDNGKEKTDKWQMGMERVRKGLAMVYDIDHP